ncbi:xanthine dehydrogenase small subunit [Acetobacter peroxydans]|jgi:xanthine dehydrogenase small subunit|uniref:xanthine dehydrogenase small subunit n=1 Tax=Acetobacter peroxydans TaxID=104098 RepID=UPI002352DC4E|nr:xanthine dehydrogenase small subunit [Acetobacter peroxydans]MCH4143960.1 xanthine dehydrogenase small subunit [Acetobacter peroxydans]MCI1395693.1 xanthine dehydrogenase small subunit [Acetobacter peroxydans]MCI1412012.1 xanthine dehydrogenase small subunit [Acetobacter peroxydans]MCI1440283.1 xanthine dehydrogenase small subunit [Acetobacter peroxydans]MCI1567486.1 xanthine dehydrogenase small subunit [Acetobacter peroxydans]
MRQHVRFYLGDRLHELEGISPSLTLLDWLREHQGRTGTKEGCNEGDCGACTVMVVRSEHDRLQWRAVNACIQFLWMLDGAQVFTVEDLAASDGILHPVQQAMVELHGSQCGFCTPGFVMSMAAHLRNGGALDDAAINVALAGNLCRCTGYAPIVRAMRRASELAGEQGDPFDAEETAIRARLSRLREDEPLDMMTAAGRISLPTDSATLAALYARNPSAVLVAGATDVGLWVTKQQRDFGHVIAVRTARDLNRMEQSPQGLWIGAAVTYTDAMAALTALLPEAQETLRRIGSTQVRNSATVCGNIGNASPIGDGPPLFIAAGATLHLRKGEARRCVRLEEYFLDYGRQDRQPGEFIEGVFVPTQPQNAVFRAYKVSKRFDQDISAVMGAFSLEFGRDGLIAQARLAFGGMAGVPRRAVVAERALIGRAWSSAARDAAMEAVQEDFSPLSDMRGSAWYRTTITANLLSRFFEETAEGQQVCLEGWRTVVPGVARGTGL